MVNTTKKVGNIFDEIGKEEEEWSLCGIDEAGRGPLAGPLVMAGVILTARVYKLADSKMLSETEREKLYERIVQRSRHHLVIIEAGQIDNEGLSLCLRRGLEEIVDVLGAEDVRFLFDGNSNYGVSRIATQVKADVNVREVSAASILAKVTRDRLMLRYAERWPEYGFDRHKGYGTRMHLEAIARYGYCPIHRRSFRIKAERDTPGLFADG